MNFFSVLDESDNEEERKVVPAKKGAAAPAPAAKKDAAAPKKDAAPAKKDAPKTGKAVEEKPKSKDAKPTKASAPTADGEKETAKEDNRGGNRHRERHGEKQYGEKRPEGEKRAPRREFDRRSGTGRGREVSRGGRGAFGAGNPAQDALDAEKNPKAAAEGAIDGAVVEGETEEVAAVEDVTPAEPEPVTVSLDDFYKQREEARQRLAELTGTPAPVRTVDKEKDFAGLTTVATAELENYLGANAAKAEAARKDQRSSGKAVVLNVGFKFQAVQPDRERDERPRPAGGRGGDREGGRGPRREGGAGRGDRAPRGDRPAGRGERAPRSNAAFNAEKDFPKL